MGVIAFICYIVVAAICAFIAEKVVPGVVPGGFITSVIVGIVGAWIGGFFLGQLGPSLGGIALFPCILGSALLVFGLSLLSKTYKHKSA